MRQILMLTSLLGLLLAGNPLPVQGAIHDSVTGLGRVPSYPEELAADG